LPRFQLPPGLGRRGYRPNLARSERDPKGKEFPRHCLWRRYLCGERGGGERKEEVDIKGGGEGLAGRRTSEDEKEKRMEEEEEEEQEEEEI